MVAFRLCDRGFACEHCPFDAAMRRDPLADTGSASPREGRAPVDFPVDRLYSEAHVWVQTIREGRVRAGIDAYAAHLLHPVQHVDRVRGPARMERGEPWCVLQAEGGDVPLALPISGRITGWNAALEESPVLATGEPYGAGWIAEIALSDARDLDRFVVAACAQERTLHDARQFRRAVAFRLMSRDAVPEPVLDVSFLNHTRRLVGSDSFVSLAREFLH